MRLSLIIPAHNEENRIGNTLADYLSFFAKDTEVMVVINACQDRTLAVVEEKAKIFSNLKYIDIKEPVGKGGAVREGFKRAQGDLIGFVDADGATSPSEFKKLVDNIGEYDGIIASRYLDGAQAKRTFSRNLIGNTFHLIQKIIFNLPYRDTQCGAKLFKKEAIKKILLDLRINNMVFDIEILASLKKYGYRVKEMPTVWQEKGSSSLLGSPWKLIKNSLDMFFTLIKLRLRFKILWLKK